LADLYAGGGGSIVRLHSPVAADKKQRARPVSFMQQQALRN